MSGIVGQTHPTPRNARLMGPTGRPSVNSGGVSRDLQLESSPLCLPRLGSSPMQPVSGNEPSGQLMNKARHPSSIVWLQMDSLHVYNTLWSLWCACSKHYNYDRRDPWRDLKKIHFKGSLFLLPVCSEDDGLHMWKCWIANDSRGGEMWKILIWWSLKFFFLWLQTNTHIDILFLNKHPCFQ